MLNRKVLISDIDNLTDARYFAAWMVDWLVFHIEKTDVTTMEEITSWIAGADFGLEINENSDPNLIFEIAEKTGIKALFSSSFTKELIATYSGLSLFKIGDESISSDSGETYQLVSSFKKLRDISKGGVWIKAGGEEKTGLKDFESLDHLFESLEIQE